MYKVIYAQLTLFLAMCSFSAHAQMSDRLSEHPTSSYTSLRKAAGDDAVAVTREMTNRLHLNEAQFVNLLPLNRTRLVRLKSINREYKYDEAARVEKINELEAQYEQECSRILTPSQLSQLQHGPERPAPTNAGNGVG